MVVTFIPVTSFAVDTSKQKVGSSSKEINESSSVNSGGGAGNAQSTDFQDSTSSGDLNALDDAVNDLNSTSNNSENLEAKQESPENFEDDLVTAEEIADMLEDDSENLLDEKLMNDIEGLEKEDVSQSTTDAGSVVEVNSEAEYINEVSDFELDSQELTIDKETGDVEVVEETSTASGIVDTDVKTKDFEKVFDEEKPSDESDIVDVVDSDEYFEVIGETDEEIQAINRYASKQLIVCGSLKGNYGAEKVIVCDDSTTLNFSDEESTKKAYEELVKQYGEDNVLINFRTEHEAVDWGYNYMQFANGIEENKLTGVSGKKVLVAVIDSGFNIKHPIYKGESISSKSKSFVKSSVYVDGSSDVGHGTAVAGLIANSTPSNVSFLLLKDGDDTSSFATDLKAMEYAAKNGAHVINCSFGGSVNKSDMAYFTNYIDKNVLKYSQNPVIICSVGNDGKAVANSHFPSGCSNTISVGAINSKGVKAKFSNTGSAVDFVAPGVRTVCASKKGGYVYMDGTSFSCPYISAAAALIKARNLKMNKSSMVSSLKSISVDLGTKGKDTYYGYGVPKFKKYSKGFSSVAVQSPVKYTGKDVFPKVTVKDGNTVLSSSYYTVSYPNGRKTPGTHTARVVGKNGYSGTYDRSFFIERPFSSVTVQSPVKYTGKDVNPKITVKNGNTVVSSTYYTVSYPDGRKTPGTHKVVITAKNGFTGTYNRTFEIVKQSITTPKTQPATPTTTKPAPTTTQKKFSEVTVEQTVKYTGSDVNPKIVVKSGNTVLGTNYYTVSYPDGRRTVGAHKVVVTGKNGYTGTYNRTFTIVKDTNYIKYVTVQSPVYYTGTNVSPSVRVSDGSASVDSKYYDVSYPDGQSTMGKKRAIITGKNGYSGSKMQVFEIKPRPVGLSSGKYQGKAYISWSDSLPANYQIGLFSDKRAKKPYKTLTTSKNYYYCYNNKGKIFYRVRVYGYDDRNNTYYSDWSNGKGWNIK